MGKGIHHIGLATHDMEKTIADRGGDQAPIRA